LTLSAGKAVAQGDTRLATNEFGDQINCKTPMGPWKGPQLYFEVSLDPNMTYKVALEPSGVDLALYAFPANTACDPVAINAACDGHWRDTPDMPSFKGKLEAMLLSTELHSGWIIVVDTFDGLEAGAFKLSIEEFIKPDHHSCTMAKVVGPVGGKAVVIEGDTIGASNEFSQLSCGQPSTSSGKVPYLVGPQLYYKAELTAGEKYRINLKPTFSAGLYLFSASSGCQESGIETDCSSGGASGDVIGVSADASADLYFEPSKTGTYLLAVDSVHPIFYGPFTLSISEHSVPVLTAPFSLDFEGSCQDLVATGDWECGAINFSHGANCKLGSKVFGVAPPQGHSGKGMWGTKLNDCHTAMGNNSKVDDKAVICTNMNIGDDSVLKLRVDLPGSWSKATLTYWSWEDINSPHDWAEIRLDNKVAYQHCEASYSKPTAWVKRAVDLSQYVGATVEVAFHFMASQWVNYAGWYIDDLSVSGS
jgi:hypothetical protein